MPTGLKFGEKIMPIEAGDDGSEQGLPLTNTRVNSVPELSDFDNKEISNDKQQNKDTALSPEQSVDNQQTEETAVLPQPVFPNEGRAETEEDFQDIQSAPVKRCKETEKGVLGLKSASAISNQSTQHKIKEGGLKPFERFLEKLPDTETHGFFTGKVCRPVDGFYSEDSQYSGVQQLVKCNGVDVGVFQDNRTAWSFIRKKVSKQSFNKDECIIPLKLNHPHIVELFGVIQREVQTNIQVEIYMEYCGPTLNKFLEENFPLLDNDLWNVIYQGISALEYLLRHEVIHFDIKPDNLCILRYKNQLRLKMIDFGSAERRCQALKALRWTYEYMSPESCQYALQQRRLRNFNVKATDITPMVDVYSFGLTIAYILTRRHVIVQTVRDAGNYNGLDKNARDFVRNEIIWKNALEEDNFLSKALPGIKCSTEIKTLLARMCCPAKDRWTSGEILQFLEARKSKKTSRMQILQPQCSPLREISAEAPGCRKRKTPCQPAERLDSSMQTIQSEQEQHPATDTAIEQSSHRQNEQPDQNEAADSVRNSHAKMPYNVAQMMKGGTNPRAGNPAIIRNLKVLKGRKKLQVSGTVQPAQRMAQRMASGEASESQNREARTVIQNPQDSPNIQPVYGKDMMKPPDGCAHHTEHDFPGGFADSE